MLFGVGYSTADNSEVILGRHRELCVLLSASSYTVIYAENRLTNPKNLLYYVGNFGYGSDKYRQNNHNFLHFFG